MAIARIYARGHYVKLALGNINKKYYPVLATPRGEPIRYSKQGMKTATQAKSWAKEWAERINMRVQGKYPILQKSKDRDGRYNIYFEDLG